MSNGVGGGRSRITAKSVADGIAIIGGGLFGISAFAAVLSAIIEWNGWILLMTALFALAGFAWYRGWRSEY